MVLGLAASPAPGFSQKYPLKSLQLAQSKLFLGPMVFGREWSFQTHQDLAF